jgi:hypothetical protein
MTRKVTINLSVDDIDDLEITASVNRDDSQGEGFEVCDHEAVDLDNDRPFDLTTLPEKVQHEIDERLVDQAREDAFAEWDDNESERGDYDR